MAKLIVTTEGILPRELELRPGKNSVGRSALNDFAVNDASVSGRHCEITVADGAVRVKDLGSTNGTYLDDQRVEEAPVRAGQRLRLGAVEMALECEAVGVPRVSPLKPVVRVSIHKPEPQPDEPPFAPPIPGVEPGPEPEPSLGVAVCANHPQVPARLICKNCHQLFCEACVTHRQVGAKPVKFCRACGNKCVPIGQLRPAQSRASAGFYSRLPLAFVYPFKKDGLILLIGGTVMFAVLHILQGFSGIASLGVMVLTVGYLFAYMQRIIVSSAQGEDGMPDWPDFSNYWDDIILPFLQLAATWLVCLGPAIACAIFAPATLKLGCIPLFVLGLIYFPMALLAVAMYDTVA